MKRTLKIVGIVVVIIIVIVIALPLFINVNTFRPKLESELSDAMGRQVTVGNLSLSIFSGSVGADNIAIADDPAFSKSPFITAKSLKVGVEVMPLIFSKTLNVTNLTLDQPDIVLLRSPAGTWNFSSLGANNQNKATAPAKTGAAEKPASQQKPAQQEKAQQKPGPASKPASSGGSASDTSLSIAKLNITNGRVTVGETNTSAKQVYSKVDVSMRDFSFTSKFPFTVSADLPGGGTMKLDGSAGPINSADTAATPLQAKVAIQQLDLAKSGFLSPAAGISGTANVDGTLNSDGKIARVNGTAQGNKLKFSEKGSPATEPVNLKYAIEQNLARQAGTLSQGDIDIGKALAHLTGTYQTQGATTLLNMHLVGDGMPVDQLEPMLPALGVVLPAGSSLKGGTLSLNLAINGPVDKPVIAGPIKLANTRLAGFNLGSKLSAISALSGKNTGNDTEIQVLSTNVHAAPDGIRTDNVNLVIPALGTVTGAGTISPAGALNYKLNIGLTGGAVTGITQLAGLGGKGGTIPVLVQGTTTDPRFMPDLSAVAGNALQRALGGKKNGQTNPANELMNILGGKKPK
ncbi:MAG TPA: AsmA family protein [Terriglobales bacterium]|nr:AsmA family protein [Terriglobales bacterium]